MNKIFLAITIGLFSISTFAQKQQNRHEFSLWGAGGISTFCYDLPADGDRKIGFGGMAGLGYNYFFNYNWSLGIGAEFSILNAKSQFDNLTDYYYMSEQPYSYLFNHKTEGRDFEEAHHAYYINIPLMLKYQTDIAPKKKFYAAIGPKVGIPMKSKYDSWGSLTSSARFMDDLGVPHTRDWFLPGVHDFGTTYGASGYESDLKLNFIASVEAGIKWEFNQRWSLYTGLFADFGLNDIRDTKSYGENKNFFDRLPSDNTPGMQDVENRYTRNSIFFSNYNGNPFVDKVRTFSFGLKAQLAFGTSPFNKKEKVVATEAAPVDKPYEGLTAAQMEDIMKRSNKEMMDFQRKEFDALKELIQKEDPELVQAIINFDLDKHDILPRMYPELDKKVDLMNKYPKANLLLEGHTDDQGSMEYNYELGLARANAAKEYLVKKGVSASRLSVASKGKTQPVVPNNNEAHRYMNRRVEFILVK